MINEGLIKQSSINNRYKVSQILTDDFEYFGQVAGDYLSANGIGRAKGDWGMYEG